MRWCQWFRQNYFDDIYVLRVIFYGTGGIVYKLIPVLRLTVQLLGNTLDISWPASGARLQAQTNGLSGGSWFTVPGSTATNRVVVPIDQANSRVFYRLTLP